MSGMVNEEQCSHFFIVPKTKYNASVFADFQLKGKQKAVFSPLDSMQNILFMFMLTSLASNVKGTILCQSCHAMLSSWTV